MMLLPANHAVFFILLIFVPPTVCGAFGGSLMKVRSTVSPPRIGARTLLFAKSLPTESEIMIETAERFMTNSTGYFSPVSNETLLADDFIFRGPVIGPLAKSDYADVLSYFKVFEALPDVKPNCFGFSVDPSDPLRVWFFVRATGTYQQSLGGALGKIASSVTPPDGRNYRGSTEAWSLTFNEMLQVRCITAGYIVDRFEDKATTDGRGLTFGVLSTLGLSLPTAPGDPRLRLVQWFTALFDETGFFPKVSSKADNVPKWWSSEKSGADP